MTNRDAINLLEEVKVLDDTMYAYNPRYLEALDMALTALEAEETWYATHEYPPKTRWIPCSERLPEEDGSYLVSGKWGSGKESVGDCEFSVEDGYFQTAWNFDVLAWMPLPEPYKKDGEAV